MANMSIIAGTFTYINQNKFKHHILLAEQVRYRSQKHEQPRKTHYIYFAPGRTAVCERVLEEEGVYGDLIIGDYHLDLIPLDTDLLSFEYRNAFYELYNVKLDTVYLATND
jgi:hypothetical protein